MRSRFKFIVPGLLLVACAGLFWWRGHAPVVSKQPAAQPPAAATNHPAAPASTNAAIAKDTGKLSAASTNRLAFRLSNTSLTIGQLERNRHAILLENAFIDTGSKLNLKIPSQLQSKGDPGAFIVQARGAINNAFRAVIAEGGGQIVSYIPNNAYLVQMSSGAASSLTANPLVQSVLPYEPYYKVQSSLLGLAVNQDPLPTGTYLTLGLYASSASATIALIQQLGGIILSEEPSPFGVMVRVRAPADWVALADLPGVQLVEQAHLKKSANDLSRVSVGVSSDTVTNVDYMGLYGANVLVEVNDTGIDATHPDFSATGTAETAPAGPTRVIGDFASSLVDNNGHGTHVAGIIAGNGAESYNMTNIPSGSVTNADFRGKAPLATLYSVNFNEPDFYLQQAPALTNALISNNSWVNDGDNEYDLSAASYDAAVRDALPNVPGPQPVLFVFSAGDDGGGNDNGTGGSADTILSPATAKNVITVGSLEQLRNITNIVTALDGSSNAVWAGETSSSFAVAGYSARGNVGVQTEGTFGRFKPDVVAPGTFVVSTRSTTWDQQAYYNPTNFHAQLFPDQQVMSNTLVISSIQVPQNAVGLQIQIFPDTNSPVPFPTNIPIYVSSFGTPDPNDPTTYDFATFDNLVSIPPDSGGTIGSISDLLNGGITYAVGMPTNYPNPIIFDLLQEVITTNDLGNQLIVLSNLNDTIGPWYRYETGTSMSAPAVSGVLALMQDFFTNTLHETPSPALLKAMLINGARVTGGYQFAVTNAPNPEGWGEVELSNSIPLAYTNYVVNPAALATNTPLFFVDQSPTNVLATGDQRTYLVSVPSAAAQSQQLKVTLAWTDPPGNPAAAIKLVNDLEVVVTNLATGDIYYANNFGLVGPPPATIVSSSNDVPVFDPINNVKNIAIPPTLGTNYSVTVIGEAVNVNAVTENQTNIVQDFALVISCGDGDNTNGISVTTAPNALVSATVPLVTYLPSTNGIYFDQIAGSSSPWLSTNFLTFGDNSPFATNAVFYIGQTNQWHFYVVTNTFAATNSAFTNAAFIVFMSDTLAIPREGVFADSDANSTRPEAELGLFVSSAGPPGSGDPNAASITNLDPGVLSNCLFNVSGDAGSFGRGGVQFVAFSNSVGNQIYYIGVQSEDQTAGQFGIVPIFSAVPFSTIGSNGDEYVTGVSVPVSIPVGNNAHPGSAYVIGLALTPMDARRVVVTNTFFDQNFGDLIGSVSHSGQFSTLNNHDGFGVVFPTQLFIYDDSGQGDIKGAIHSDGPGSLNNFVGQEAVGPWLLTEVDDGFVQTGSVTSFNTRIEPHQNLNHNLITATIAPNSWFYDYIDVPVGYTNLLVVATNLPPTIGPPPLQLFVNEGSVPTFADTNMALLTNSPLGPYPDSYPGNSISVGPPLKPDRYFIGIFNPDSVNTATVELGAILSFDASAISLVDYDSINHGVPIATPIFLPDDAVTNNTILVTNTDVIQEFKVGLRVDHPRISDLSFTLIDPNNNRYLLMENRGGQTTNGCGATVVTTNAISTTASGNNSTETNIIFIGQTRGTFPISYNMFTVPDEMTVYYGTNVTPASLIYDSGLVSGTKTITVSFPPSPALPPSPYLTIVMNQFGNAATNNDAWNYTAGGVLTNFLYLTFTEDTNFTTTPIKFAPPPFVPFAVTNIVIVTNIAVVTNIIYTPTSSIVSTFDSAVANDYAAGTTVDGWSVAGDQVSVVADPTNAQSGNQFLTLARGSIVRTLTTTPGSTNTLTFTYRGPGIAAWWRGENNANDTINGNNGTIMPGVTYAPGEVGNAFNFNGTSGYISVPASTSLDVGVGGGFTIEAWDNPSAVYVDGVAMPMVEFDSTANPGVHFWDESPRILYANIKDTANNDHQISSPANAINTNVWQHVAVTYNKSTGMAYLYVNGVQVNFANFGSFRPQTTFPLNIGTRITQQVGNGDLYSGLLDEVSIYNRALSASEIKAISSAGNAGKFDQALAPPQNLAEAQYVVAGVTNNLLLLGANNGWQTNTVTFVATNNGTSFQISGLEPGMLLDSFNLSGFLATTNVISTTNVVTNVVVSANNLYYQPEVSLAPLIGTSALGNWQLEVLDNRAGATNPAPVLVDWQLEFEFANTNLPVPSTELGSGPQTNVVGANSIEWYQIQVPNNVLAATNALVFASLPVNLWYSVNVPPTITRGNDFELLANSTGGTYPINTTTTTPTLVPGSTYYLGVQNTNNVAVTNVVQVSFLFGPSYPVLQTIPTQVVAGGATLVVTNMATDTNAGAVLQYTLVNPPAVATIDTSGTITWPVPANIAPTNVVITTIVTDTFTGLSATNSFDVLVLPGLLGGQPQTNVVGANSIEWYLVQVPTNAVGASNSLLFATLPVNLWFSVNVPPSITNPNDFELLLNSTNGSSVIGVDTSPVLVPGMTYYLGVQNTNSVAVTNAVEVTFLYPPSPLTLPSIPTQIIDGGDTLTVTNTATDTNPDATLTYTLVNPPTGAVIDANGIITWPTTPNIAPTNVVITTIVLDSFGLSATNTFEVIVLPGLAGGQPQTNVVGTNSIEWYRIQVPANAVAATNTLLFATSPVNLWFSVNVPPTITNSDDFELLTNVTGGVSVISTNTVPLLVPGSVYYLGVQNTNNVAVTNAVEVTFEIIPPPVFSISSVTVTNIGGTNGYLVTWFAPTNLQFHLQWTSLLAPATWQDFKGVISFVSYVTATSSQFNYFDDGSQTGGFGPTRFYRLQLLNSPTNTAPYFVYGTPPNVVISPLTTLTVTNLAADYDIPAQTLTYTFTNNVTGANVPEIDPGSGTITWTPDLAQVGTTNQFTTTVTDNGVPAKSVTDTFTVIVTGTPSFSSIQVNTNGVFLQWLSPTNDEFQVRWTTNLAPPINWGLFPNFITSSNGTFNFTDTNALDSMKFYQLILLP